MFKIPWRRQPRHPIGIDKSNPITSQITLALLPTPTGYFDASKYSNQVESITGNLVYRHTAKVSGWEPSALGDFFTLGNKTPPFDTSLGFTFAGYVGLNDSNVYYSQIFSRGRKNFDDWNIGRFQSFKQMSYARNGQNYFTSNAVSDDDPHFFVLTVDSSGSASWYIDGNFSNSAGGIPVRTSDDVILIHNRDNGSDGDDFAGCAFLWNRVLTVSEIKSISANPWQIFEPVYNRVKLFAGVTAGGGTSSVSQSWPIRHDIANSVAENWDIRHDISNSVSQSWSIRHDITNFVSRVWNLRHDIFGNVSQNWSLRHDISNFVSRLWTIRHDITNSVTQSWSIRHDISNFVSRLWTIRHDILAAGSVTQSWPLRHDILNSVMQSWSMRHDISNFVSRLWNLRHDISNSVSQKWDVRHDISNFVSQLWSLRHDILAANSVAQSWPIRHDIANHVSQVWNLRHKILNSVSQNWSLRHDIAEFVSNMWDFRHDIAGFVLQSWLFRHNIQGLKFVKFPLSSFSTGNTDLNNMTGSQKFSLGKHTSGSQ